MALTCAGEGSGGSGGLGSGSGPTGAVAGTATGSLLGGFGLFLLPGNPSASGPGSVLQERHARALGGLCHGLRGLCHGLRGLRGLWSRRLVGHASFFWKHIFLYRSEAEAKVAEGDGALQVDQVVLVSVRVHYSPHAPVAYDLRDDVVPHRPDGVGGVGQLRAP